MKSSILKKILIIIIIVTIILVLLFAGLFLYKFIQDNKAEYVQKENVSSLVSKFNKEITDDKIEFVAKEDSFVSEDDFYWYELHEDVVLHIAPVKFSGELKNDIVLEMGIFYDKNSPNEKMALSYLTNLIKANVNTLTDEEVQEMINHAKEVGKNNVNTKKGTGYGDHGLIVTYWDNEDNYHYSVEREMENENEKNS